MRLTRRGRRALTLAILALCAALWWQASSIPDMCLTRDGYMPCMSLEDQ